MFKQYIENNSISIISQIYYSYQEEKIINENKREEFLKKGLKKGIIGLALVLGGGFLIIDGNLFGFIPLTLVAFLGFSLDLSYQKLFLLQQTIINTGTYNVLSLIKELEAIQKKLQVTDIEKLIYALKILHLEEKQLDSFCIEQLITIIEDNFEEINSSKLNNDLEMEIGQTSLQKLL